MTPQVALSLLAVVLVLLGVGAALSGEVEPANLMLGLGIGTMFGTNVTTTLATRKKKARG